MPLPSKRRDSPPGSLSPSSPLPPLPPQTPPSPSMTRRHAAPRAITLSGSLAFFFLFWCSTTPGHAINIQAPPPQQRNNKEDPYTFDTQARNKHILEQLKTIMPLEVLDDRLAKHPNGSIVDFVVPMKDKNGDDYRCFPEAVGLDITEEEGGNDPPEKKLNILQGACTVLSKDWWSYEWCHRKEIRQFHLVMPTTANKEPVRDPDWSLGVYENTEVRRVPGSDKAEVVIDHFTGGQMCYEINQKRLPKEVKKQVKDLQVIPFAVAQLASIQEVSLCNYTVTICTPLMCDNEQTLPPHLQNSKILMQLEPMASVCLTRHEGYWSYEFCYKKWLRQFHTVAMRDSKGRTFSKVDNEYIIGLHTELPPDFQEDNHIVHGGDETEATYFHLEYTNGTKCDLTDETRATSVHFVCGDMEAFVSIKEDRSCHYKVMISTPRLCRHPAFAKQIPKSVEIVCAKVNPKDATPYELASDSGSGDSGLEQTPWKSQDAASGKKKRKKKKKEMKTKEKKLPVVP